MEERTVKTEVRGDTPSPLTQEPSPHVRDRPHLPITSVQSATGSSYFSFAASAGGIPMSGGYTANMFTSHPYYSQQGSSLGDSAGSNELDDTEKLPKQLREYLKLPIHIRKGARYPSDASEQPSEFLIRVS